MDTLRSNIGLTVGGVLGVILALVLIIILVVAVVLIMRYRNSQGETSYQGLIIYNYTITQESLWG